MWVRKVYIMIKYLAGAIIGMVIGYFTNYIAVKMLFRPREEKYLFGHKLPFTPGAIPKGKNRLAKSAGSVVAETLLTGNDISEKLLSDEMEDGVINSIMAVLKETIGNTLDAALGEESKAALVNGAEAAITDKVIAAIKDYDYETLIKVQGMNAVKAKLGGSMLMMFVSDDMINGILDNVVKWIDGYIEDEAEDAIRPMVSGMLEETLDDTPLGLAASAGYNKAEVREAVVKLYHKAATTGVRRVLEHIDIASVVEDKINDMSVEELERLVLEVMKHELNMIVNLGALIGFVLGLLNIFI